MTDPYRTPDPVRARALRELAGLLLLIVGVVGLLALLWTFDWRYAAAVLAGIATHVGWRMATGGPVADDEGD